MRPSRLRRSLAGVAAATAIGLTASACNSSPVAASVNGTDIAQTALSAELHVLAANRGYVAALDTAGQGHGFSVGGDAAGTYNNAWVADVLTQMITGEALQQTLARQGRLPGPATVAAAAAVDAAAYRDVWYGFPAWYRATLVRRDAEHDVIEATSSNMALLSQAYRQNRAYFATDVCVRQVAVSVSGSHGVDYPASLAAAQRLVATYDRVGSRRPGAIGGSVTCYGQSSFASQPVAFIHTVMGLAPGRAAPPRRTGYGYEVVAVERRTTLPFDAAVRRALSVAIAQEQGSPDPALAAVLRRATVTVGSPYGTWVTNRSGAPSVQPPSPPSAGPTG